MDQIKRHIKNCHKGEQREGMRRKLDPEQESQVKQLEVKRPSWQQMYEIIYPENDEGSIASGHEGAEVIREDGDHVAGELWHYFFLRPCLTFTKRTTKPR